MRPTQSIVVLQIGVYTPPPTTPPPTARRPLPRPVRDRDATEPPRTTARALSRVGTRANGRHDLPWRATRDRWLVLVSEVMLHQTQAPRVAPVYDDVHGAVPHTGGHGRRGARRRHRGVGSARLPAARPLAVGSRASHRRTTAGPTTSATLPGVGRYTAAAVAAQADDADAIGIEVNIRRVCERVRGARLRRARSRSAPPSRSRRRCTGATGCSRSWISARWSAPRAHPRCDGCPIARRLRDARRAPRRDPAPAGGATRDRSAQRRGHVLARLRRGSVRRGRARRRSARVAPRRRPRRSHARPRASPTLVAARPTARKLRKQLVTGVGEDRLGMELHALDRELAVAQAHHEPVFGLGGDLEHVGNRVARRRRASDSGSR